MMPIRGAMQLALPSFTLPTSALAWGLTLVAAGSVVAIALLWLARAMQRQTGVSADAEVVASDTGQNRVKRIHDPDTGLYGQPDYVLREEVGWLKHKKLVPVELKPSRRSTRLYESDEMQLVVYMVLLRKEYGDAFAGYGYVQYAEARFKIDLTPARIARCLEIRDQVRANRQATTVARSHRIKGRCVGCSVRRECGQSLA